MSIDPAHRMRLARTDPAYLARLDAAEASRDAFARRFGLRPVRWSSHNLSRLLRATGERPARVAEMRATLGALGLAGSGWVGRGGVFDHGEMWGKPHPRKPARVVPAVVVGHPYQIEEAERYLLEALARFNVLRVAVDDVPSYYGFGTNHVRVELVEPARPWEPGPSTYKTRAAARAARRAFAEELGSEP
jgi:hypothetical protein